MDTTALQSELLLLIKQLSYKEGSFQLASGKMSSYYIDLKPTSLHPRGAFLIGNLIYLSLKQRFPDLYLQIQAVAGLTLGADPLLTAVSLRAHSDGLLWPAVVVRKEPKKHGTAQYLEGVENLKPGNRILVLEDVVTTGGSSLKAVERLKEAGYQPLAVFGIVDREEGGRKEIEKAGCGFQALFRISELRN